MRVAVLTVTRDRLAYTQHCCAALRKNAGIDYSHYVFDNGSEDDTPRWLLNGTFHHVTVSPKNIGLSQGFNKLLDVLTDRYDVIVKMDNDCELVTPGTLKRTCELAQAGFLLSPKIRGLHHPPQIIGHGFIQQEPIELVTNIGGIFMAAPAEVYDTFRPHEDSPAYGYEDVELCKWWRKSGGAIGYLTNYPAWHYERVDEQLEKYPEYQERKMVELA
jgi:GT2 family glycosyltransferase